MQCLHPNIKDKLSGLVGINKKIIQAECTLAAVFAEHNLPFLLADHLVPAIKNAYPDSRIAEKVKCGRIKTRAIIVNVLGFLQNKQTCEI